jgi:hypothetical protein
MRTVLIAATALATGFILSAAAQQATQNTGQANQNTGGCGPSAMADHASQGISQGGFTRVQPVAQALLVHAIDPDGNPVTMIITPASNQ